MSNQRLPFLPLYIDDWETDSSVRQMGPVARYYYLALLMHQWREGCIPSDKQSIQRILHFPTDWISKAANNLLFSGENPYFELEELYDREAIFSDVLSHFVSDGKGALINKRLEEIRIKHLTVRKAQSEAANKTNEMKGYRANRSGERDAKRGESHSQESYTEKESQSPSFGVVSKEEQEARALPNSRNDIDGYKVRIPSREELRRALQTFCSILGINNERIPANDRIGLTYFAGRWWETGEPSTPQQLAKLLNEGINHCKKNLISYPAVVLLKLKEIQRGKLDT